MAQPKYLRIDDHQDQDLEKPLPLWRKLCFAVGGAPYQITSNVVGFFLNIFLLEVAQLKPRYISIILFSGKAWDAITDPSIGILVQHTDTRWGKMRPWIILGAPFACATYFLLFYVPFPIDVDNEGKDIVAASDGAKFAFYFAMFCLFEGFLSCLHVPYTALTMYVATNQKDRDSITGIRMAFEAMGVLLAVLVQGSFVSDTRCNGDEEVTSNTTSIAEQRDAYAKGSYIVIAIYIVCCLVVFFGSKEEKGVIDETKHERVSFFAGLKLVFTFKPYVYASLVFVFFSIAIAIVQGNVALFCTHVLKMGDQFSFFVLVLLLVTIVSMPIWQVLCNKFGKKKIYAIGMIMTIPVLFSQMYLPKKVEWLYYLVMVVAGLGISVALLLPWSVLPDVLDLYMLEKHTRHDALFYSFYVFFNKLAAGIALAASQVALDLGGYVTGECRQPDSVGDTLRLLMTPGPTVLVILALGALYKYPIDEQTRKLIRHRISDMVIDYRETVSRENSKSYESIKHNSDTEI